MKEDAKTRQELHTLDDKVRKLIRSHADYQHHVQETQRLLNSGETLDDESRARIRELVLQLRLDNEAVIPKLIQMHKSFCLALGIDAMKSELTNLERLKYSLGSDDVVLELTQLHDLMDKLEHVYTVGEKVRRAQERQRKLLRKLLERLREQLELQSDLQEDVERLERELDVDAYKARTGKYWDRREQQRFIDAVEHQLTHALELQTLFHYSVDQLTESFQEYGNIPKFGLIYDYLAGLKGPISRFHLAYQNGIGVVNQITQQLDLNVPSQNNELVDVKQRIHNLSNRLQKTQQQQQQLLLSANNQQQQLKSLTTKLSQHPSPQQQPTVNPSDESNLQQRMNLRRTLKLFP